MDFIKPNCLFSMWKFVSENLELLRIQTYTSILFIIERVCPSFLRPLFLFRGGNRTDVKLQ